MPTSACRPLPPGWHRQAHTVRPYRTGFAFSALLMPYRRAYLRRAGGHKRPYGVVSSSMGLYIMMAWFSVMNSSPARAVHTQHPAEQGVVPGEAAPVLPPDLVLLS